MMIAKYRKATLQALHTDAGNKAVKREECSARWSSSANQQLGERLNQEGILDSCSTDPDNVDSWITTTTYKGRIRKDATLNVCTDCGMTPQDFKHLLVCSAHPTTMTQSDLWSKPVDTIGELSHIEVQHPY